MRKIGTTSTGVLIVEMTETEYRTFTMLPPEITAKKDIPAIEALKEARRRGEIRDYHLNRLSQIFQDGEEFAGATVSQMLRQVESTAPDYRIPGWRFSRQLVQKLRDVLERSKNA